jgi:hypothetical protein
MTDFKFGPTGPYRTAPAGSWGKLAARLAIMVMFGVSLFYVLFVR